MFLMSLHIRFQVLAQVDGGLVGTSNMNLRDLLAAMRRILFGGGIVCSGTLQLTGSLYDPLILKLFFPNF